MNIKAALEAGNEVCQHSTFPLTGVLKCQHSIVVQVGLGSSIAQKHKTIYSCTSNPKKAALCLIILLFANSNDVHKHPGPTNDSTIYPCGTCDEPVTWEDKGIMCDTCHQWYHTKCQSVSSQTYNILAENSGIAWDCIVCDCPNYSSVCFDHITTTSNRFSVLSETSMLSPLPTEKFRPAHASTPDNTKRHKARQVPLKLLVVNFQSIKSKQGPVKNLIESTNADIIIGTETWIDPTVTNNQIFPSYYDIYRRDRNMNGGGVLIAIKNTLISEPVPELQTDCEIVWARINLVGAKTLYLSSYYHPKTSDEQSILEFQHSMERATRIHNAMFIIGGDFNFPGWNWKDKVLKPDTSNPSIHYKFADILDDHGLIQMVEEPTRGTNILDLVLTNNPSRFPRTIVIPGLSDHDVVFSEVDIQASTNRQKPRSIPLYRKANWDTMRLELETTHKKIKDLAALGHDAEELWTVFKTDLNKSIESHVPHKTAREKSNLPWISPEIRRLIHRRDRLYKKKKKSADPQITAKLKDIKRQVQRELRRAYWKYVESIVTPTDDETPTSSMKKFWTYIKHQRTDKSGVAPLRDNGIPHSNPIDQATILNRQFQSAFSESCQYGEEEFRERCDMGQSFPTAPDLVISENGILKLLQKLNPNKAAGPDDIKPRILKELATHIAPILYVIFGVSLDTGVVPRDCRCANVSPVYKKGEKYIAENYRSISLTCICCKLMEHIVTSHIMNHADNNSILYPLQHGFRSKRSCETQLVEFVEDITCNMAAGKQTDILIMDFSKAFDKVCHSLLVHKLRHYGIRGKVNQWIGNFLS